eukprot:SAG31_NODE_70_length_28117_cov_100.521843_24_plen_126_part_00
MSKCWHCPLRQGRRQDGLARRRKVDAGKASAEAIHFHARIHELSGRVDGAVAAHVAKAVEVHQRLQGTTAQTNETRNAVLERHQGLEAARPQNSERVNHGRTRAKGQQVANRSSSPFVRGFGELR